MNWLRDSRVRNIFIWSRVFDIEFESSCLLNEKIDLDRLAEGGWESGRRRARRRVSGSTTAPAISPPSQGDDFLSNLYLLHLSSLRGALSLQQFLPPQTLAFSSRSANSLSFNESFSLVTCTLSWKVSP